MAMADTPDRKRSSNVSGNGGFSLFSSLRWTSDSTAMLSATASSSTSSAIAQKEGGLPTVSAVSDSSGAEQHSTSSKIRSPSSAAPESSPPLKLSNSFTSSSQYNYQQQQRRRANYRVAASQQLHSHKSSSQSHCSSPLHSQQRQPPKQSRFHFPSVSPSNSVDHEDNRTPATMKSSHPAGEASTSNSYSNSPVRFNSGNSITKTSSFDDCYIPATAGFHDAFALLGGGSNERTIQNSGSDHTPAVPSSPSKSGRVFLPSSPMRNPHNYSQQYSNGIGQNSPSKAMVGNVSGNKNDPTTTSVITPPSLTISSSKIYNDVDPTTVEKKSTSMPNIPASSHNNDVTNTNSAMIVNQAQKSTLPLQLPASSGIKARSVSSPLRSSSPLTVSRMKMKQSLQKSWNKSKGSDSKETPVSKPNGKYSMAVAHALQDEKDCDDSGAVVKAVTPQARMENRFRTRSPSPVRILGSGGTVYNTPSSLSIEESDATDIKSSSNLEASINDEYLNANSASVQSSFHGRNIRTLSPARIKDSLKKRFLDKVPSSPRKDTGSIVQQRKQQTVLREQNPSKQLSPEQRLKPPPRMPTYPIMPNHGIRQSEEEEYGGVMTNGIAIKSSTTSFSFEVEDEENHDDEIKQNRVVQGHPKYCVESSFIINKTSFIIFESEEFLKAMGGTNEASLTTNYIRTGDTLCIDEEQGFDRALPLYYAGLGAILSRIRKWTMERRGQREKLGEESNCSSAESHLVYEDFSNVARCQDTNVLLLAMASILLRAGNAHFSLKRFDTACRDYVSAQSFRSLRSKVANNVNDEGVNQSLSTMSSRERDLYLEDVKLNGRISNNMASAQSKRKMYDEARAEYTKALHIKQKALEAVHDFTLQIDQSESSTSSEIKDFKDDDLVSDIAATYHNIGLLRINYDEPKKAEKAYKQSLSLRVKKFGLDDLGVSSTLCALGHLYFHQKRYDDAFRSFKESLRIWKFRKGNNKKTAELYYNIGLVFYYKGPYSKAKVSITESLRIRKELFGNENGAVAVSLQLLGLISTSMGDYDEALSHLEESLAIRQILHGKNSPNHLLIHNVHLAMGKVYSLMGNFEKAMKLFSVALMGRIHRLGKHHPCVSEVLQAIGVAYIAVNEYSKALKTLEEALHLRRTLLGPCFEVAETLDSLSLVYFSCEDADNAIEFSEESLSVLKSSVGYDHILVAKVLRNTGDYCQNIDLYNDAIESYNECLRVMTVWHGRDHAILSEVLNQIGVCYFKKEEYMSAKQSFMEALKIMRLNPNKIDKSIISSTLSHLGHAYYKNEDFEHAAESYLESLKIQMRIATGDDCEGLDELSNCLSSIKDIIFSESKREDDLTQISNSLGGIATTLRYLGLVNHALGESEKALSVNKLSLSVRLCQPFKDHSAIALLAETIAMFEFKRNNLHSALEYFSQALEAKKTCQDNSTIDVARTVNNLANIHFSLGNLDDAMKLYEEALEIKRQCLGENSDEVANTLNNIAHVMVTAEKYQEALEAYHNVLKIRQERYGKNHVTVAATLACMGDVFIKLGKLEIAMTYFEQCIRIRKLNQEICDERVMENLASIYGKLGEWQKAEAAFKEILHLKKSNYGNDSLDAAKTLDLLAVSYIEQDRYSDSIEHLKEALRIRKLCLGGDDDEILASLHKLAFVYKSCDMTEQMLEVKAEFEGIQSRRRS